MTVESKSLTISSFVFGGAGFVLFLYCKLMMSGKRCPFNFASKMLVAIGVFLLAGAVYELSQELEDHKNAKEKYSSTSQDPDSLWSYQAFSAPPPRPQSCG